MHDQLKQALDQIHAEEELKRRTEAYVLARTREIQRKRSYSMRRWGMVAACFAVVLVGVGGYQVYFTPTSAISIDVNPSMEMEINRFDRVIAVQTYGKDVPWQEMPKLEYLDYASAVEQLLAWDAMEPYLDGDDMLSISVIGDNEQQQNEMLSRIETCTQGHNNVTCHAGNAELVSDAHEAGLSFGKYQVFLELQALDPSITVEEVQDMTMRQLRERLAALTQQDGGQTQQTQVETSGYGAGSQGHHGHHGEGHS